MQLPLQASAQRHAAFSRRRFLRGAGACIGLPAFESLCSSRLLGANLPQHAVATTTPPVRSAFVYVPNGVLTSAWWPATMGRDFVFSPTLAPLAPSRSYLQVLGGLANYPANRGPDGGGDNARASGTFLTGVRISKSGPVHNGISIDQLMASQVGHLTKFPSLALASDLTRYSGGGDSGYAGTYLTHLSWSSPTTPVEPESNPRALFERLFGEGATATDRKQNIAQRQQEQNSILDFVTSEAHDLGQNLSMQDNLKLDEYLTGVREVEKRIQQAEQSYQVKDPGVDAPASVPADYGEYIALMYDMMVLAFQTDSTRVISLLLAHETSNRAFPEIGIPEGHMYLSHHNYHPDLMAKVAAIDLWYVQRFANFLKKMEEAKDVDGSSLLRNTQIVYGSGIADGNFSNHINLPILLAGAGGGTLKTGQYVKLADLPPPRPDPTRILRGRGNYEVVPGGVPLTNLYLSMDDRMGLTNLERFGDSTGRVTAI